jgi:hypothetical protein
MRSIRYTPPDIDSEGNQAEKDAAAARQAANDRGDELPIIAPRREARLGSLRNRSNTEDLGNGFSHRFELPRMTNHQPVERGALPVNRVDK